MCQIGCSVHPENANILQSKQLINIIHMFLPQDFSTTALCSNTTEKYWPELGRGPESEPK